MIEKRVSKVFIQKIYEAIIYGKKNGIPMEVMESGFEHAFLHAYLLNLNEVPPIPEEQKGVIDIESRSIGYPPNVRDHRAGPSDQGKADQAIVAGSGASTCWADAQSAGKMP